MLAYREMKIPNFSFAQFCGYVRSQHSVSPFIEEMECMRFLDATGHILLQDTFAWLQ